MTNTNFKLLSQVINFPRKFFMFLFFLLSLPLRTFFLLISFFHFFVCFSFFSFCSLVCLFFYIVLETKQTWISDASILLTAPYFSDNKFIRFSLQRDTGPVLYVVDFPKVAIENFSEEKENLNDDIEDNETELFDQTPQNKKRGGTVTLELHFVIF